MRGDLGKRMAKYRELQSEGWEVDTVEGPKQVIMKRNVGTAKAPSFEYLALKANGETEVQA